MSETAIQTVKIDPNRPGRFAPIVHAQQAEIDRQRRIETAAKAGAREAAEDGQPWRDKAALAEHLSCSVRWIEVQIADARFADDPFPCETIAGRIKFKIGDVEAWRARHPETVDA
jgi:hypothetical protein